MFKLYSVVGLLNLGIRSEVLAGLKEEKKENAGYSRSSLEIARRLNEGLSETQKSILRRSLQVVGHKGFWSSTISSQ